MRIEPPGRARGFLRAASQKDEVERDPDTATADSPEGELVEDGVEDTADGGAEPGVIRLLRAGHFKGVADVRLRINFHDRIAALHAESAAETAEQRRTAASEAVNGEVESLLTSGELSAEQTEAVEGLLDTFTAALQAADGESGESTGVDEGDASTVESVYRELEDGLKELLLPEQPAEPAAEEETSEGTGGQVAEETATFDDFLSGLREAFQAALSEVGEPAGIESFLPSLSPAEGNGAAYEKFLRTYRQVYGLEAESEPASDALTA